MSENVLVTGAGGFIGTLLIKKLLSLGKRIISFDENVDSLDKLEKNNANLKIITGNLNDKILLTEITKQVDIVYHLAAKVHSMPHTKEEEMEFFKVNVEGTKNLLEACVANNVAKFIFFSSVHTIELFNEKIMDENTPCKPMTAYSKSKYEAERLVIDYHRRYSIFVTILKLPLVYGPNVKGNFKRLIESIEKRQFRVIGNGQNLKSIVYVENIVDAAIYVANNQKANSKIYIISDSESYSLNKIAQTIASELGVKLSKIHIPKWLAYFVGFCFDILERTFSIMFPLSRESVNKLTANMVYSSEKIKRDLGFKPKFGLQEGIIKTIAWYKSNKKIS